MKLDKDQVAMLSTGEFDQYIEKLRNKYLESQAARYELLHQVSTWNEEGEIGKLHEEIDSMKKHAIFFMNDTELERMEAFCQKHWTQCRNAGSWIYEICQTGIGMTIKVKCPTCGEEEDITDVESW